MFRVLKFPVPDLDPEKSTILPADPDHGLVKVPDPADPELTLNRSPDEPGSRVLLDPSGSINKISKG